MNYRERLKRSREQAPQRQKEIIDPVSFVCIPEGQPFVAPRSIIIKDALLSAEDAFVMLHTIDGQVQELESLKEVGLARGDMLKVQGGSLTGVIMLCR